MPFGTFNAIRNLKMPKPPKPEKAPPPPPPVEPPPMVFRDFRMESACLNIVLCGRTLSQLQDFLCAISENISTALHQEGMTCYTTENSTITLLTSRKQKLKQFFREFRQTPWPSDPEHAGQYTYRFHISASGNQGNTVELIFHCFAGSAPAMQADARWYLADGAALDPNVAVDGYREFIRQQLQTVAGDAPVCLLLSQIEHLGHFSQHGGASNLSRETHNHLLRHCRSLFACPNAAMVSVIPVQVYGGLEYTGVDGNGNPLLQLFKNGYYQSYAPENCQIPVLHTIDTIGQYRELDYLTSAVCGSMRQIIHRHFQRNKANANWKPDTLQEV